jgi:hypothetical protein
MRSLLFCSFLSFILVLPGNVFATGDNYSTGGQNAGLAGSGVAMNGLWSLHHNQAGLGFTNALEAGIYYENRFLLKSLGVQSLAVVLPTNSGTFGIQYTGSGNNLYREHQATLGYGLALGKKISAGLGITYQAIQQPLDYGSRSLFMAEFGVQYQVNEMLTFGAHVFNVNRAKVHIYNNERAPTIFRLGGMYKFSNKTLVTAEVEKDIDFPVAFRVGFEFKPVEYLYLRAGVASAPVSSSFGAGFLMKGFKLDLAFSFHRYLGFTPQAGLIYTFQKK